MTRWCSSPRLGVRFVRIAAAALLLLACSVSVTSSALAHAELRQSSPASGETVGGAIHSIVLQFFDLDLRQPVTAAVFDAAGNELAGQVNQENQRAVIALVDPITTPGDYLVTYAMTGIDGDFTEESFTFTWQDDAPEPAGITVDVTAPGGFDVTQFVLLLIGGGLAAFIVHRFIAALKEHKAAQAQPR